ncbi:hypothetical protein SAMN02745165_01462 [Malonomonas rubra DSM 5091]|uniref:Chemotaxis phosphatase CheX n=1 Tax=Malonomonas rubra DSM 5091 TaxID=1122189 RepID=A0A1M6G9Q2_MALRU|nr:hypothetical protein [Malonomonas rubra]SHJ06642.1 hypothetical protein SAMN02745165_01462 [Malonomonas rubra DSM 5091]
MDQRGIIDVVCRTGVENLATEIGALLGRELSCNDIQLQLSSKDTIFSDISRPTTALTRMTVSGDKEGDCFLLTPISSSIMLGGTLIMLPEDMIEEHIQSGKLDGELSDAFGEVANIIAGVFTQAFVDKYAKTIRFIKKTVEELVPTKIDLGSSEPFPPGTYYVASCILADGDEELGQVEFIVPVDVFELESEADEVPAAPAAEAEPAAATPSPEPAAVSEQPAAAEAEPVAEAPAAEPKPLFADAKKLTDTVFNATISQIGEEIGALLGQDLKCDDIQLLMTSKADFFANHCTDRVNMAYMKVSGDREGCGFMFTQIPDAIVLGGTLIMLPDDQIEEQASQKVLEGEVEDAFGEVANILAGGLTQVFLDRYPKQIRFVRTESTLITPTKIDMAGDEPFPEGDYYLASFSINMEGQDLDRLLLLFPAHVFDLDGYSQPQAAAAPADAPDPAADANAAPSANAVQPAAAGTQQAAQPTAQGSVASQAAAEFAAATTQPAATAAAPVNGPPLVLVIAEDPNAAQPFTDALNAAQFDSRVLSFQDDIKAPFQSNQILGAVLIMSRVNEKGFATAIKLQSSGQALPPLIFAGPEWTRTTVLRAIKYGARDILITPTPPEEIQQKIGEHFKLRQAS